MVRRMELIKPVAWFASRQVTIAPIGESPVAQSTIMPSMECVGFESHPRQQVRYTLTSFVQSVMVLSVANLES